MNNGLLKVLGIKKSQPVKCMFDDRECLVPVRYSISDPDVHKIEADFKYLARVILDVPLSIQGVKSPWIVFLFPDHYALQRARIQIQHLRHTNNWHLMFNTYMREVFTDHGWELWVLKMRGLLQRKSYASVEELLENLDAWKEEKEKWRNGEDGYYDRRFSTT